MSIYSDVTIIPTGSRKYGVYTDDTDYDFVLLVPESRIQSILDAWEEGTISRIENPLRYRVTGTAPIGSARAIPGVPEGATYDLTVTPKPDNMSDSQFLAQNWRIYWMIHITDIPVEHQEELVSRLTAVKAWAKENNVYGGAYPDGISYFIYTMNTILKGYDRSLTMKMMYQRCLYYHREYKYTHVGYVSNQAFAHIRDLLTNKQNQYSYTYRIASADLPLAMRNMRYLLDRVPDTVRIRNDGTIYSQTDILNEVTRWVQEMNSYNIQTQLLS